MRAPTFLRHVTPWWLLALIDSHSGTCWYALCMWKIYGAELSCRPCAECFQPNDYCGKFPATKAGIPVRRVK